MRGEDRKTVIDRLCIKKFIKNPKVISSYADKISGAFLPGIFFAVHRNRISSAVRFTEAFFILLPKECFK
jgi:hypothetical protein